MIVQVRCISPLQPLALVHVPLAVRALRQGGLWFRSLKKVRKLVQWLGHHQRVHDPQDQIHVLSAFFFDSAYGGQAMDISMHAFMGNGWQAFKCPSCAIGFNPCT